MRVLSLDGKKQLELSLTCRRLGTARNVDEERVPDVDQDQADGIGSSRGEGSSSAIAYEAQLSNRGFDFETSLFGDYAGVVQYIRHCSDGYASAFGNILDARTARPCTIFTKLTSGVRDDGMREGYTLTTVYLKRFSFPPADLRYQFLSLGRPIRPSDVETNQRWRAVGANRVGDESTGGQDSVEGAQPVDASCPNKLRGSST